MYAAAIILAVASAVFGALDLARSSWRRRTGQLHRRIVAARVEPGVRVFDASLLAGLPPPVQQYFREALQEGQRMVAGVDIEHRGTFNMSEAEERWKPFRSSQHVVTHRPGFIWNAKIAMLPGVHAFVHDAYVAGEGILHASALGLVNVVNQRGDDDLAHGELMRFLAEAVWYPTALLPGHGIEWDAIDDHAAQAKLTDGDVSVSLIFRFGSDGLVESVEAPRARTVHGAAEPAPWHGRFWNYQARGGMRIPIDGEVAWIEPEGAMPYWRGRIEEIEYYFAE